MTIYLVTHADNDGWRCNEYIRRMITEIRGSHVFPIYDLILKSIFLERVYFFLKKNEIKWHELFSDSFFKNYGPNGEEVIMMYEGELVIFADLGINEKHLPIYEKLSKKGLKIMFIDGSNHKLREDMKNELKRLNVEIFYDEQLPEAFEVIRNHYKEIKSSLTEYLAWYKEFKKQRKNLK